MMRMLLFFACLGAFEAQKIYITLKPKETSAELESTTEDGVQLYHSQLLNNIKEKGVQGFVGQMSLGTPPQLMSATIEIFSALSFFPSVNCKDQYCQMRQQYNSSASSTYEEVGTAFELVGGQNASGVLSKDSIDIAGVTVDGVVFGEVERMWNKWYKILPQDGVLGLGLSAPETEGSVRPILDIMAEQGLISERVFALWLGKDREGGQLTLGGLNEQLYNGELSWTSLSTPTGKWWSVPADMFSLEDHPELDICPRNDCFVLPAASSPYFFMSLAKAQAVNEVLGGQDMDEPGAYVLDCTTLYKLPILKIVIGGRTMEMGPLEYTFLLRFPGGLQMCISGFLGLPEMPDNTIATGTLFMQKFYVAYDRENNRIGFADSA